MFELTSTSPAQTLLLGEAIASQLQRGDCLTLDGELGVGKTQLVRGLASGLDIDPHQVASPTFVVMHEYEPREGSCNDPNSQEKISGKNPKNLKLAQEPASRGASGGGIWLIHIDAYRLNDAAELDQLGWKDEQDQTIMVIEWADRVVEALPADRLAIFISHAGLEQRDSIFTGHGRWADRLETLEKRLRTL